MMSAPTRWIVWLLLMASPAWAGSALGPLHSHNDYEQGRPLEAALQNRFLSVEADVWTWGRDLQVGHFPGVFKGSFRELYLLPLLTRVFENRGSVHGDGRTFYLWVEFKDANPESVDLLVDALSSVPIFTEFTDQGIRQKAVTVIVTGNEQNKRRMVERAGVRLATRDSEWLSSSDPAVGGTDGNSWLWYGLDWKRFVGWDGRGAISPRQLSDLRGLQAQAHRLGRKVRFFGTPDRRQFWELARSEGLDLVGTDRVEELARFWAWHR